MNKSNEAALKLVKNFKRLGAKKFFEKWKQGIDNISPLQQTTSQLIGSIPVLIGFIIGICVNKTFWVLLCLIGGLIMVLSQEVGMLQRYIRLKVQDKIMKELSKPQKKINNKTIVSSGDNLSIPSQGNIESNVNEIEKEIIEEKK